MQPSPPIRTPLGTWTNSNIHKAHAFAHYLAEVFQPHPSENLPEEEEAITHFPDNTPSKTQQTSS
jgi:hypothetical protein